MGRQQQKKVIRTAGKPHRIELSTPHHTLNADGKDLAYVTLRIVDKDGNLCPTDGRLVTFNVKGAGRYRASANGDPTCLDLFHLPRMHAFNGMLTVILQASKEAGTMELKASAKGLKSGSIQIDVKSLNQQP